MLTATASNRLPNCSRTLCAFRDSLQYTLVHTTCHLHNMLIRAVCHAQNSLSFNVAALLLLLLLTAERRTINIQSNICLQRDQFAYKNPTLATHKIFPQKIKIKNKVVCGAPNNCNCNQYLGIVSSDISILFTHLSVSLDRINLLNKFHYYLNYEHNSNH